MRFTKMHGCGNDYVYVDGAKEKIKNASKVAIAISDRHMGIGSDGLIIIQPSKKADFRMEMYNLDGSESGMCGSERLYISLQAASPAVQTDNSVKIIFAISITFYRAIQEPHVAKNVR